MRECSVSEHGYFLDKQLRHYVGGVMLTAEQMAWAKYLTVDFDGSVYVWDREPQLWTEEHPHADNPFNHAAYTGRWVQPKFQDAYCESILKLHTFTEEYEKCIFKIIYEDNKNDKIETDPSDFSGLEFSSSKQFSC